jgi:hypothetical protein
MTKKENTEKSVMVEKLKLFNNMTRETIVITDDEMANYDARLWQIVDDEVKNQAIRLEDIEARRQEQKQEQQ